MYVSGGLLGTRHADSEQLEGFFLNRRWPSGEDDLGLWVEGCVSDVVGQRRQILYQGLKAVQRQTVVGALGGILAFGMMGSSQNSENKAR